MRVYANRPPASEGVLRILSVSPLSRPNLADRLGVSQMTVRRAIEWLLDQGVWLEYRHSDDRKWHLVNSQPNWQSLTLAELVDAGCLTREAAMILGWKVEQVK